MKKLVLIDGHHLMHRAYWAIPRTLKTRAGLQVNAVFGTASMLINIIAQEDPDGILFCFDAGKDTFRHQQNPTYKDGRSATPDDFFIQMPLVHQLIDTFNIPQISDPELEADDLLASYAVHYAAQGSDVVIVSGDKDLYQLAGNNIRIAIPHKGYQAVQYLDANGVKAALGVEPAQVAGYKGLCGDNSDNLLGVRGIGPKTAVHLLNTYNNLKGIYEHLDELKGTVRQKLETDKEQAFFCEHMATLITDAPLQIDLTTLLTNITLDVVQAFFVQYEFTMLLRRLPALDKNGKFDLHISPPVSQKNIKTQENLNEDQLSLF